MGSFRKTKGSKFVNFQKKKSKFCHLFLLQMLLGSTKSFSAETVSAACLSELSLSAVNVSVVCVRAAYLSKVRFSVVKVR